MELLVLDTELKELEILDSFESLIWTDRYCESGDFEIYHKVDERLFNILQPGHYLWNNETEHVMIIENRKIETDAENGDHIIITGRSLESLLTRRIIWKKTVLSGNLQNGIKKLLNENIIFPEDPKRQIQNFIFEDSIDAAITDLQVNAQFTYDNLYDAIYKLCIANGIGFKITLSNENKFIFKLYSGKDRSYNQLVNPYVVFSEKFENLIQTNYMEATSNSKNVTLIAGEGEGENRKTTVLGNVSGLERREMHTDARDLSQTVDDVVLSEEDYIAQLSQRGHEDLAEHVEEKSFEGSVDTSQMFKFGQDFFLGDIVQITNEYGIGARARIAEIIYSQSTSGIETYPTFVILD
jgi:hypothetical protein